MKKGHMLIIEDDPLQRRLIRENLEEEGFVVFDVPDGDQALDIINRYPIDIAVVDYKLQSETGVEVIQRMLGRNPLLTPIVVTAFGNVETAVEAIKKGAYDYIVKPIDFERFLLVVERALERQKLMKEVALLQASLEDRFRFDNFVFASAKMQEVARLIHKASQSDATVLISGETGTGKELVAKTIHYSSRRKEGPFLAINIPSLPESLMESELFGAEKGAYTGAHERKIGKFEAASGGTLLLDEIGDLPSHLQVKLLRLLQEKEFFRLGASKPIRSDVRVIAATHRDLESMVGEETFRSDLYFRLNVVRIHVPPLRDRKEDIPPLTDFIIRKYSRQEGKEIEGISQEAMNALLAYPFPGNIRELENVIERAIVFAEDEYLRLKDLPMGIKEPPEWTPDADAPGKLTERVERMEKREIRRALEESGGVKSRAAQALGITERMLSYKIKKYGL
jgi:DNA-binding NtrC family response regulator